MDNIPIVDALKNIKGYIKWCTPSVLLEQEKINDVYNLTSPYRPIS